MVALSNRRQFSAWLRGRQRLFDKDIVVKLGGAALEDPTAVQHVLSDIVFMTAHGARVVLVHGGGKSITRAMSDEGIEPRFIRGRRFTDDRTLAIVGRVLADQIAPSLVDAIDRLGGRATALTHAKHRVLLGERLRIVSDRGQPEDLGHVGAVTAVDSDCINDVLASGCIPVVPSVAMDATGHALNVNADSAASALARFLGAEHLVFVSDVPGICLDPSEPRTLCSRLDSRRCRQLVADGRIHSGMLPKVDAALSAVQAGVRRVHILDGRAPEALLSGLCWELATGTEITG